VQQCAHEIHPPAYRGARAVVFADLQPADGELVLDVAVSPDGAARYCYIGALVLEKTD
jgi:hypothetical protein